MKAADFRSWLLCFAVLALATSMAAAQAGTTSISGQVTDPAGAVVPGATVTLTSEVGVTRSVRTDESGMYRFASLPAGTYTVRVEAEGFRTHLREAVSAPVDTPTRVPITLQVGAPAEVIEVVGDVPGLQTESAAMGNPMSLAQVQGLPLEARNIVALLSLQTGAVFLPGTDEFDPRTGSISGSRADQGNVTLDGVDVNDPRFNTAYESALRMTQDAVQEFRVTTSNYGADAGRSSGAQVSMVTRGGTNQLHGSAYWAHRNTAFSSNEFFNKTSQLELEEENKPPLLQKHIWGAALGGPIIRDRFFLFGNLENLREKSESSVLRDIPSNSFRDGVLIYQCAGGAGACPGGTVQGLTGTHTVAAGFHGLTPAQIQGLDPLDIGVNLAAMEHFALYPSPNDPGVRDERNIAGFRFAAPLNNQLWTYIARADFNVDRDGNHRLFWRGNLMDDEILTPPQFPGLPPNTRFLDNSRGMAIGYTSVLSPRVVNNFRYGFTRLGRAQGGLLDSNRVTFRFIDPLNALTSTNQRVASTHNFTNDVSIVRGSHTLQAGANFRFARIPTATNALSFHAAIANGSWNPDTGNRFMPGVCDHNDPLAVANPNPAKAAFCQTLPAVASADAASFADLFTNMLGVVNQVNARFNFDRDRNVLDIGEPVNRRFANNEYELYFQDQWRAHPTFTLTMGLRWSLFSPPWETNGNQIAPDINMGEWLLERARLMNAGLSTSDAPMVSMDLAGPANNRDHYYPYHKRNFSPRFAFAWTPRVDNGFMSALTGNGTTVIRGGYSLIYDRLGHALATRFDEVGSFGMATLIRTPFGAVGEDTPGVRFTDEATLPPHTPAAPAPEPFPLLVPPFEGKIEEGIDASIRTPYAHVINFLVGREMPWESTLEVGYVGRLGRRLLARRDLAMIANLRDPVSGMDYFTAVQTGLAEVRAQGIDRFAGVAAFANIAPLPFWENMFPGAASGGFTATQVMLERFHRFTNHTDVLWLADQFCIPTCSILGEFAFFAPQWDSLASLSSVGTSGYNAMQVSWRKRPTHGLQFDFNYTWAKAIDDGSNTERGSAFGTFGAGGISGFLANTWEPWRNRGNSDFDIRHLFNANWVYDLPFGRGRALAGGAGGALDAILGGWQVAGIWRYNTGLPFAVWNGRRWPTNWNLTVNAELIDPANPPTTSTTLGVRPDPDAAPRPNVFADPQAAHALFRFAVAGEQGLRNNLRGDNFYTWDVGIGKAWTMPYMEGHRLRFRWDVFNLTNTAKFDPASLTVALDIGSSFGRYSDTIGACDRAAGRCMQVNLRYEF